MTGKQVKIRLPSKKHDPTAYPFTTAPIFNPFPLSTSLPNRQGAVVAFLTTLSNTQLT